MSSAPQTPQYPQGNNKYGTAGYDPNQNFEMTKPPQVGRLAQMTVASLLLFLLSMVLTIVAMFGSETRDLMKQQLEESGQALPQGTSMDDFITVSLIGTAALFGVFALIGLVVYALVLLGIKNRWGWTRILGIIAAIVGTLYSFYAVISSFTTGAGMSALTIISVLLMVVFVVVNILWLKLAFNGKVAAWLGRRA